MDNYGEGTTLNGKYIGQYDNLTTGGLEVWYQKPNNQRMGVIEIPAGRSDATYYTSSSGGSITTNLGGAPNNGVPAGFYPATASILTDPPYRIFDPTPNKFVTNKGGFTANSSYASAVEIANISNGYDDSRYGSSSELHDIVFTGAMHVFSSAEAATVETTGILPISKNVYGGDCYVSSHAFKLTDNHYMIEDATGVNSSPIVSEIFPALNTKWTYGFVINGSITISMPVGGKNISQVVQVILESEYNGEITGIVPYTTYTNSVVDSTVEASWRVSFAYPYHFGLLKSSDQKAFTPFDVNAPVVTDYPSRFVYSDQKIYNTDIFGFDIFRVASFTDLEDTYRGITKLTLQGDSLIALQNKAVVYIPVDANTIETRDTASLSIGSSQTVGVPRYISRQFGTQHLKTVISQDNFIIFVDNINKSVLRLSGDQVDNITDIGTATAFRTLLATSLDRNKLYAIYDNRNRQVIIYQNDGTFAYVWDDRLQVWIGTQTYTTQNRLYDGVYFNNYTYLLGRNNDDALNVYKAYEGTPGQLFGNITTPSITFSVNDEFDIAKTFDNFVIYSSDKLDTADITAEKEPNVVTQVVTNQDIEIARREGAYRVAILRDSDEARIRGTRATVTLKWVPLPSFDENNPTTVDKVSLSGVITKYRFSPRNI